MSERDAIMACREALRGLGERLQDQLDRCHETNVLMERTVGMLEATLSGGSGIPEERFSQLQTTLLQAHVHFLKSVQELQRAQIDVRVLMLEPELSGPV